MILLRKKEELPEAQGMTSTLPPVRYDSKELTLANSRAQKAIHLKGI